MGEELAAAEEGKRAQSPAPSHDIARLEDIEDMFQDAELLDFATNLDFEKYLDDLEFREKLEILRDRARKLARQEKEFQSALDSILEEGEEKKGGSPKKSKAPKAFYPEGEDSEEEGEDQEAKVLKKLAQTAHKEMKAVHSKASTK